MNGNDFGQTGGPPLSQEQQKTRIAELESQLQCAKHMANPQYEQLEHDYKEVEADLDEVTKIKQRYEREMEESAKALEAKEVQIAEMKLKLKDYPVLEGKLEQLRKEYAEGMARLAREKKALTDSHAKEKQRADVLQDAAKKHTQTTQVDMFKFSRVKYTHAR